MLFDLEKEAHVEPPPLSPAHKGEGVGNHPAKYHLASAIPLLIVFAALVAWPMFNAAFAQTHHPFAVGANEGAVGQPDGLGAWLLAQQSRFYLGLTQAVRATRTSAGALWLLLGLSFAYGVFHAAGPGHGKAVITSYMVSNEVALRRGLVLAALAALVQALVATALVGIAALVFDATAPSMTAAAQAIELAGYAGIVAMGLLLVWRKGRAFAGALRPVPAAPPLALAASAASPSLSLRTMGTPSSGRFVADDGRSPHPAGCNCCGGHIPDAALLERERLDWRVAAMAVATAGARPCSGAILVLVFALSQQVFPVGIAAVFAMAAGTALTTGALATAAVLAKDVAVRWARGRRGNIAFLGRLIELGAALCILGFGLALLTAALSGVRTAG